MNKSAKVMCLTVLATLLSGCTITSNAETLTSIESDGYVDNEDYGVTVLQSNYPQVMSLSGDNSREVLGNDGRLSVLNNRKTPYDKICKVRVKYKNELDIPVYYTDGTSKTVRNTFSGDKGTIESTGVLVGDGVILLSGHAIGLSVTPDGIAYGSDEAKSNDIFDFSSTYVLKSSDLLEITLSFGEYEDANGKVYNPLAKVVLLGEDVFDDVIYRNPEYLALINKQRTLKGDEEAYDVRKLDIAKQDYGIINLNNTEVDTLSLSEESLIDDTESQAVVMLASSDDLAFTDYKELNSLSDLGWFGYCTYNRADIITFTDRYYVSGYPSTVGKQKGYFLDYEEALNDKTGNITDIDREIKTRVETTRRIYEDYCKYPFVNTFPLNNSINGDVTAGQSGGPVWNFGNAHKPYLAGIVEGFELKLCGPASDRKEYGLNYITPMYIGNDLRSILASMGCTGEPKVYEKEVVDSITKSFYPYSAVVPAIYKFGSVGEGDRPVRNCVVIGDGIGIMEDDFYEEDYKLFSTLHSPYGIDGGSNIIRTDVKKVTIPNSSLAVVIDESGSDRLGNSSGMLPVMTEFKDGTEVLIVKAITDKHQDIADMLFDNDQFISWLGVKFRGVRGTIKNGRVQFNEDETDFEVENGDIVIAFNVDSAKKHSEIHFGGFVNHVFYTEDAETGEPVKEAAFTSVTDSQLEEIEDMLMELYEGEFDSGYTYITRKPSVPKYMEDSAGNMVPNTLELSIP